MNTKIKLKYRTGNTTQYRNNTDYTQNHQPHNGTNKTLTLANKKTINLSQNNKKTQKESTKYANKSSILMSKLATEIHDKNKISVDHKLAADKIFNKLKIKDTNKQSSKNKSKLQSAHKSKIKSQNQGKQRYQISGQVGSGTFGIVFKARDKKSLEMVAIKRVFQDKKYKNRELEILKILKHPNVLEMKDSFFTYEKQKEFLNVVMDYYPLNLQEFLRQEKRNGGISKQKLKVLSFQMFKALLYLGQMSIAHRDIKPHNILVSPDNWKLSICDFGSAKQLIEGQPNISYICSRCYRAPELIFGNTTYTTQIDVWSAGCVFIEMITGVPIFRANSNIDQLVQIVKVMGTPSRDEILEMNPDYQFEKFTLPNISKKPWKKILKGYDLSDDFLDLLDKIMKYNPKQRYKPCDVLCHHYFDEIKRQEVYRNLKEEHDIPDLFGLWKDGKNSEFRGSNGYQK